MGEIVYALQFSDIKTGEDPNRIIGIYSSKEKAQAAAESYVKCKIDWQCNGCFWFAQIGEDYLYYVQIIACEVM